MKKKKPTGTQALVAGAARKEERRQAGGEELPPHESHGLIGISRCSGRVPLFGSPVAPYNFIELRIHEGIRYHGLGHDRFHDGKMVCTLRMSETQFAQMITTPNQGVGVPCTLKYRHTEGFKKLDDPPTEESEAGITRRQFKEDVADTLATMDDARARVKESLDNAKISGKLRESLMGEIFEVFRVFDDYAPYAMKAFEENVQTAVATAKTEVVAFVGNVARETGLAALRDGAEPVLALDDIHEVEIEGEEG
jgi:hypothetical protein